MDNLENVEDLTSLWNFDVSYEGYDDIKMQLQYVMDELAEARKKAKEQAKINKENVKKLIHLLGSAYKERDEAKAQLHKLLMVKPRILSPASSLPPPPTTTTTTNVTDKSGLRGSTTLLTKLQQPIPLGTNPTWDDLRSSDATTHPTMSPRSPLMMMMSNNINLPVTIPNSGMTSHSNTPSSSMDSYLDVGSSPESYNMLGNPNCASSSYDISCMILMDNLAEGRPRPEKGKLLQSVMEAGPLLDSLLVAGPLPKWMNPPQVVHAPQVPPLPISVYKRPRYNESL